jgi:hypothetical protein
LSPARKGQHRPNLDRNTWTTNLLKYQADERLLKNLTAHIGGSPEDSIKLERLQTKLGRRLEVSKLLIFSEARGKDPGMQNPWLSKRKDDSLMVKVPIKYFEKVSCG